MKTIKQSLSCILMLVSGILLAADLKPDASVKIGQVADVAISENGKKVWILAYDGQLFQWDAPNESSIKQIAEISGAKTLTLSGNDQWLCLTADKSCQLVNLVTSETRKSTNFADSVYRTAFISKSNSLWVNFQKELPVIWSFDKPTGLQEMKWNALSAAFDAVGVFSCSIETNQICVRSSSGQTVNTWSLGRHFSPPRQQILEFKAGKILAPYNDVSKELKLTKLQAAKIMDGGIPFIGTASGIHAPGTGTLTFTLKDGSKNKALAFFARSTLMGYWIEDPAQGEAESVYFYGAKDIAIFTTNSPAPIFLKLPEKHIPVNAALSADGKYAIILEAEVDFNVPELVVGASRELNGKFLSLDHPRIAIYATSDGTVKVRSHILDTSNPMAPTDLRMRVSADGKSVAIFGKESVEVWTLSRLETR